MGVLALGVHDHAVERQHHGHLAERRDAGPRDGRPHRRRDERAHARGPRVLERFVRWLAHVPTDPLDQLAASFHLYNFNSCDTQSCWETGAGAVAAQHPVVTGELGENDCAHGFIDTYMPWADDAGISYLGWTWNTWDCDTGPALITDYDGGATGFGQGLMAHLMTTMP